MNNYKRVLEIAKDLQDEFKSKISIFEFLQIAGQIHQSEILAAGLLVRSLNDPKSEPVALEAIGMVLGYTETRSEYATNGNLLDVLRSNSES